MTTPREYKLGDAWRRLGSEGHREWSASAQAVYVRAVAEYLLRMATLGRIQARTTDGESSSCVAEFAGQRPITLFPEGEAHYLGPVQEQLALLVSPSKAGLQECLGRWTGTIDVEREDGTVVRVRASWEPGGSITLEPAP